MGKYEGVIFLSYSRKDAEFVRKLYRYLRDGGFKLWFDQEDLLPGQRWQQVINDAIRSGRAVLLCLSSNWVDKRGFVQKEMKLALDALQEYPAGAVYLIPIRLDDCPIPAPLAGIQYLDVWGEEHFTRLNERLAKSLGIVPPASPGVEAPEAEDPRGRSKYKIFLTGWDTPGEQAIKLKLGYLNDSVDYRKAGDFEGVLELWKDVEGFEEFDLRHEAWDRKPMLRFPLSMVKQHLLAARINLVWDLPPEVNLPKIVSLVRELVEFPPSRIDTEVSRHGDPEMMEVQNQNYRDILISIQEWFAGWSTPVLEMYVDITPSETAMLEASVGAALSDVKRLLDGWQD